MYSAMFSLWNILQLLTEIDRRKKGKVKVIICGAPVISQQLKGYCQELGFEFGKENF